MSSAACVLTAKDLTILEVMLDRCPADDPIAPLLRRKINTARVVFRDDVAPEVATLNSRVVFSVDGRDPDTRVISHDRGIPPMGLLLPITTLRGLALLGLSEGQDFRLAGQDGADEIVRLESVLYQPEAAMRERNALTRVEAERPARKPVLRVIHGPDRRSSETPAGFDDPSGPSAA